MKIQLYVISYWLLIRKLFTFTFLLSAFLLSFYLSLFTVVSASPADNPAERIQNKYADIRDIQGNFYQTSYLKDLESVEQYEGEYLLLSGGDIQNPETRKL